MTSQADTADTRERSQPIVLVVGASALLRLKNVKILQSLGYIALEAVDERQAVSLYEQSHPHGVLLDISQMEATGLDVMRRLRSVDAAARIAVITSQASRELALQVAQMDARDLLVKPITAGRLAQAVQALVAAPTMRQHARVSIALRAQMSFDSTVGGPFLPCVIEDLSTGGARCMLEQPLPPGVGPGRVMQLKFMLASSSNPLLAIGRVARVIAPEAVGVSFLQMTPDDRRHLEQFCHWALHHLVQSPASPEHRHQ